MKHVLVIAYYFPPMGLSGIQRTLKFVKYLGEFGWKPTVLTITPHAYFAFDDSFLAELEERDVEIWRTPPGGIFSMVGPRRTISLRNERLRKFLNRVSQFFFIPDNKVGWRKRVRRFLEEKDLGMFDAVYSTAPPYTDHLVGLDIKHRTGLPLVIDFRDAWVEYPFHIYWTPWHRHRHEALERMVVREADAVITTNRFVRDLLLRRQANPSAAERMHVISQGFDSADFQAPPSGRVPPMDPGCLNIVYTGIFYEDRDPLILFKALVLLRDERPEVYLRLRFYMVGYVQEEYREMGRAMGVGDRLVYCGYVEHNVSVEWVRNADVLWFNIGARRKGYETVSPGKAFEYLGSGKPIIAAIPRNEIGEMLASFDHTFLIDPEDHHAFASVLADLAERRERGEMPKGDREKIDRYDRRTLTGRLAAILDNVTATIKQHSAS
ncbi:MAG TPA: glycosyltransferase [Candidatus Kapabacteria bacterium]|nr:glycosyltransferase [Candidatus Kapabacteria bacterium]